MSDRKYDYTKFNNQVVDYKWEDHHSPSLRTLFEAVEDMENYLKEDVENVVIVHCLAGKGRTGSSFCCYLLLTALFNDPEDAMHYFKIKRFSEGGGVTQHA